MGRVCSINGEGGKKNAYKMLMGMTKGKKPQDQDICG
jgi:hypothetical protein